MEMGFDVSGFNTRPRCFPASAFQVDMLPEVAELGPLATEDEEGGFRTYVPPSLRPKHAQISQGGVQTLRARSRHGEGGLR